MENNGKGIFYGVIGVATLIVAIIGATFAYFSAQEENTETVRGTAAQAKISLTVEKLTEITTTTVEPEGEEGEPTTTTTTNYGVMVPQLDAYINDAVAGSDEYGSCIDTTGNVVCQVYKITVRNDGNAVANLNGFITLTAVTDGAITNLKWAVKAAETDNFGEGSYAISTENANNIEGNNTIGSDLLASNLILEKETEEDYYVVVWISETGAAQEDYDHGSFTGTVTFNSASGTGLTSTFTGEA